MSYFLLRTAQFFITFVSVKTDLYLPGFELRVLQHVAEVAFHSINVLKASESRSQR